MKINFIGGGLFKSGGMRIIFEYCNRLKQIGHDVRYYYPVKPYDLYGVNEFDINVEIKKYYWFYNELKGFKNKLQDLFNSNFDVQPVPVINDLFVRSADVTIATQWPTAFSVKDLSKRKGKKFYFIQDYESWNSDISLVDKSYLLGLQSITISEFLKSLFADKFGIETDVVLNGIDYGLFKNTNKKYNVVRNITFIDHQLEKKGVKYSIDAIEKIKGRYSNVNFISFGLRKWHEFPDYVQFYENPNDEQIVNIYNKTDIFVFTSLIEGFGLPPAEAMACKCAVVTTKVGAIPEFSVHMDSAIHIDSGSVDDVVDSVSYLLDNENEMVKISKNAGTYIRSKLNWDIAVRNFEQLLFGHQNQ